MADSAFEVHVVKVLTDHREQQLWLAATAREDAVAKVLNAIPEGWSASLSETRLTRRETKILAIAPGDIRRLSPE
jgi:hypothetical protein